MAQTVQLLVPKGGMTNNQLNLQNLITLLNKVGDRPFSWISINGKKRTGKSFMLCHFLRHLQANPADQENGKWMQLTLPRNFHWRGTSVPETNGINVWSEPFEIILQNGKKVAIILMDTQGSFDDQSSVQHNALIFAWSTLLSSKLIFNVMKDIGEDVLQFLQFFSSYAALAIDTEEFGLKHSKPFQSLVFLIRDMQFSDYKYGYYDDLTQPVGQILNYKKTFIDPKPRGQSPAEVRFTHEELISHFTQIGLYLMPDPGKSLINNDSIQQLEPDFKHHVQKFVELMLKPSNIVTKKVGGVEVTGKQFIPTVNKWARLFEGNELPELQSIFNSASDCQYLRAKSAAMSFYNLEMSKIIQDNPDGVTEHVLCTNHKRLKGETPKIFKRCKKLGGPEIEAKFLQEFTIEADLLFDMYTSMNSANMKSSELGLKLHEQETRLMKELESEKLMITEMEKKYSADRLKLEEELQNGTRQSSEISKLSEKLKSDFEKNDRNRRAKNLDTERQISHLREQINQNLQNRQQETVIGLRATKKQSFLGSLINVVTDVGGLLGAIGKVGQVFKSIFR